MAAYRIVTRLMSPPFSYPHGNLCLLFSPIASRAAKLIYAKSSSPFSTLHCGGPSPPPPCTHQSNVNTQTTIMGVRALSSSQTFKNGVYTPCHCPVNFLSLRNFHRIGKILGPSSIQKENICRRCHTSTDSKVSISLETEESALLLHGGDHQTRCLPLIWLRDHCRCPSCYNHDTLQKDNVGLDLLNSDTTGVDKACLEEQDTALVVSWRDGHVSRYSVDWLVSHSYGHVVPTSKVKRILWNGDTVKDGGGPLPVTFASHVGTREGLSQTLRNLVEYGFAMITQSPPTLEGIKTATDRVSPVQETFFGDVWEFTSDGSFSDTAYSTGYLAAHTDTTYLEMPAGIQVFQCLGHDGSGGETLLVDGYRAVEQLRQTHPDAVRCLSTHPVPHEYKETPGRNASPGYHMYTQSPVIRLHPTTGDVVFLRYNPYDRAPLNTIPPGDMMDFYRSYQRLSSIIADPKGQYWVKLTPGTILLIDNWRVMHGRAAFDGKRVMSGCYLLRDDWMSKVRILGLADV